MDTEKIKQKLAETFAIIQELQLQPTRHNVSILTKALANLDEAFAEISKKTEEEKTDA